MPRTFIIASLLLLTIAPSAMAAEATNAQLVRYLQRHASSPDDYVVGKFRQYDVVFLGEEHYIKQNVEFVQRLIPKLYAHGVYNLGIEFGVDECQADVDRLITAERYDEDLARRIMFRDFVLWSYKEYMDLYRAAWRLNRSLPPGARKFRVVNLIYSANWKALQRERTHEAMLKVWHKGDPDVYMGERVLHEFIDKNEKALVYAGFHHTFTHYRQPIYDFATGNLEGFNAGRMGNVVYARLPKRVFGILLHTPWMTRRGEGHFSAPVRGRIDAAMRDFHEQPAGFDVKDSPFGTLRDPDTYYSAGYDDFTLGTLTDGYVYLVPFRRFQEVTVDPKFITESNLREAVDNFWDPEMRASIKTPDDLLRLSQKDADEVAEFRKVK